MTSNYKQPKVHVHWEIKEIGRGLRMGEKIVGVDKYSEININCDLKKFIKF